MFQRATLKSWGGPGDEANVNGRTAVNFEHPLHAAKTKIGKTWPIL